MCIAGVSIWPQHYRPKYILLLWSFATLIIAFGEQSLININKIINTHNYQQINNYFSIFRMLNGKLDSSNKATIY